MACCNKKKKAKKIRQKRLMEVFFQNSLKVFKSFKDADPAKLNNKKLIDYHRKCHMLHAGNLKRPKPNKQFINAIVAFHDKLVKEILKRGMKHNSPLKKI